MKNNFHVHLVLMGLQFVSPIICSGQKIILDTIVTTNIPVNYSDYASLILKNDTLNFVLFDTETNHRIYVRPISHDGSVKKIALSKDVKSVYQASFQNGYFYFGSISNYWKQGLDSGDFSSFKFKNPYKETYSNDEFVVSIESYPDFAKPKPEVKIKYGKTFSSVNTKLNKPYDFPYYFARVGHFFELNRNELCYCQTLNYNCFKIDLNTGHEERIIVGKLGNEAQKVKIDSVKLFMFKGSQQPVEYIPQLKELDEKVYRITKIFFDGKSIVIVKRAPGSGWDYRLLDIYVKNKDSWKLTCKDIRVDRYPEGKMSYQNPPCSVMDSYPIKLYNNKLYVVVGHDYTEGLNAGIRKEEYLINKDKRFETVDPHYSIYIYSLQQ